MDEIEVKVLEIDLKKVLEKLTELGAKKLLESNINSSYFDDSINSLRNQGVVLRLRQDSKKCRLTMKNKLRQTTVKIMDEFEVEVSSMETMKQIFNQIGLISYYDDTRKRISYNLGYATFDIDIYPDIPAFLEIEAPTKERLQELIKVFEFFDDQVKAWTGKELLAHYGKL